MTELNDDNPDSIVEETDADEFILTDATLADKFTEGNFMEDSDADDDEEIAEAIHVNKTTNEDEFAAGDHAQLLNNDEHDETDMDADPVFSADDKTSLEETKNTDKDIDDNVEYYWSDDDKGNWR